MKSKRFLRPLSSSPESAAMDFFSVVVIDQDPGSIVIVTVIRPIFPILITLYMLISGETFVTDLLD